MKFSTGIKFLMLSSALTACSGNSDNGGAGVTTNSAPVVDAGSAQSAIEGSTVQLSATATDADGDALSYSWSQSSGPAVTFSSATIEDPTFTAPDITSETDIILTLAVNDGTTTASDTVAITITVSASTTSADNWILNTTERSTEIFESSTQAQGVMYDVQLAEVQTIDGVDYNYVETEGIPKFDLIITQEIVDELNDRPKAGTDFTIGSTTVNVGDSIVFGEDIGYVQDTADRQNCAVTGGTGYWPPGPACPIMQSREGYFTKSPALRDNAVDGACETGIGAIGYLVNGAAIFGWGDTMSYNNASDWQNLAIAFEVYDLDVCYGHSANGDYHLHSYGRCLKELLGDDGSAHSPVIGYAADGFPVYGPYESENTFALSGWATRDFDVVNSATGCGVAGVRSCEMVDRYDLSAGTVASPSNGPTTSEIVSSLSGNSIMAVSGTYFEDFYYTGATITGAQLDQNNGHDTGDGKGYHYHFTQKLENGVTKLTYPYTFGPRYSGSIPDNAVASCGSSDQSNGGPPPGPPPGG